jgi:hypothetical protein
MKKPTIGLLLAGPSASSPDGPDKSEQEDEELPDGLVSAVGEFRSARTDEEAARALLTAVQLCG